MARISSNNHSDRWGFWQSVRHPLGAGPPAPPDSGWPGRCRKTSLPQVHGKANGSGIEILRGSHYCSGSICCQVPVKPCTVPLEEAAQFQEHSCYGPHEVEAYTYQLTPQRLTASAPTDMPSLAYKSVILKGAREHKLPQSYVEELTAIPDNGDGDHVDLRIAI